MGPDLRLFGQQVLEAAAPAFPFLVHSTVSTAAFTTGLAATQVLGYACRISCATPVLGSAVGILGIGAASVLAGQASLNCQHYFRGEEPLANPRIYRKEVLLDAVIGIALWKALGGRFRSLMPSDLFAPGAMAVESIPSPGAQYASEISRGELARLFRRDGCHHCGTKKGVVVGDHIPPNRIVWGSSKEVVPAGVQRQLAKSLGVFQPRRPTKQARAKKELGGVMGYWVGRLRAALAIEPAMPKQRYFPQCKKCSSRQSTAVRVGKRTLVLHFGGPKAPCYAGVIVGLRHYQARPPGFRSTGYLRRGPGDVDSFGIRRLFSVPLTLGVQLGENPACFDRLAA